MKKILKYKELAKFLDADEIYSISKIFEIQEDDTVVLYCNILDPINCICMTCDIHPYDERSTNITIARKHRKAIYDKFFKTEKTEVKNEKERTRQKLN